ncbi:hypothetical protein WDU94_010375 [Cyamophila willieti]
MLLPMLGIYQEYVRNHHYSLQVLTECKQQPEFVHLLKRLEMKPACQGRSLEMFLTFPMHQVAEHEIKILKKKKSSTLVKKKKKKKKKKNKKKKRKEKKKKKKRRRKEE